MEAGVVGLEGVGLDFGADLLVMVLGFVGLVTGVAFVEVEVGFEKKLKLGLLVDVAVAAGLGLMGGLGAATGFFATRFGLDLIEAGTLADKVGFTDAFEAVFVAGVEKEMKVGLFVADFGVMGCLFATGATGMLGLLTLEEERV